MSSIKWVLAAPVVALVAIYFVKPYDWTPSGSSYSAPVVAKAPTEKQKYEYAASECWKSHERKSLTPMEKINLAGFCEGLEKRARESQ